ncbi:MAG: VCBS repeat-containing protein, partial [bacterium]
MFKHLILCAFVPLSLCASEFRDNYFMDGSLERVTTSDIPGCKWVKNHKSLKLSPSSFNFKPRDWEPIPKELEVDGDPEFGDIDNDGKIDLIIGYQLGNKPIDIFENIGTKYKPIFKKKKSLFIPNCWGKVTLGDIDKDGILDLLANYNNQEIQGYKGMGNWNFERNTSFDIKDIPLPQDLVDFSLDLADLNNDNVPDFIVFYIEPSTTTNYYYNFHFLAYENKDNGFIRRADWDPVSLYDRSIGVTWNISIDLIDLDNDGTNDLFFVCEEGGLGYWYKNLKTSSPLWSIPYNKYPYPPRFSKYEKIVNLESLTGDIIDGTCGFADLDSDGDPDMIMGSGDNFYLAFECIGYNTEIWGTNTISSPIYTFPERRYLDGGHVTGGIAFADLDDDRCYEELLGEGEGSCVGGNIAISFNRGTAEDPCYCRREFGSLYIFLLNKNDHSIPTMADLDNDEKIDLFGGRGKYGTPSLYGIETFKNTSSGTSISFEYHPEWNITGNFLLSCGLDDLDLLDLWTFALDLNNDKKYDLIITTEQALCFLENIGTRENATWTRRKDWEQGFECLHGPEGNTVMPQAIDIDGDNQE